MTQEEFDALMRDDCERTKKDKKEDKEDKNSQKLQLVYDFLARLQEDLSLANNLAKKQAKLIASLQKKFPHVKRFDEALEDIGVIENINEDFLSKSKEIQKDMKKTIEKFENQSLHVEQIQGCLLAMETLLEYTNTLAKDGHKSSKLNDHDMEVLVEALGK